MERNDDDMNDTPSDSKHTYVSYAEGCSGLLRICAHKNARTTHTYFINSHTHARANRNAIQARIPARTHIRMLHIRTELVNGEQERAGRKKAGVQAVEVCCAKFG